MKQRTPEGMSLKERLEFHSMPIAECGCWIWLAATKRYGEIKIDGRMVKAHRASWSVFKGEIPDGMNVLHQCDMPACINPDHLFLGSQLDNVRDMHAKGRARKRGLIGSENPSAKLRIEDVIAIRSSTRSHAKIAAEFGIAASTVTAIKQGITWSWL